MARIVTGVVARRKQPIRSPVIDAIALFRDHRCALIVVPLTRMPSPARTVCARFSCDGMRASTSANYHCGAAAREASLAFFLIIFCQMARRGPVRHANFVVSAPVEG